MDPPVASYRLVVVAADPLARAGLVALLREQTRWHVAAADAAEVAVARTAVGAAAPGVERTGGPGADVIVWDLGWAGSDALDLLAAAGDVAPVLALAPDEVAAREAMVAGVRGLLPRDATTDALVAAVHAVALGLVVRDPRLVQAVRPDRPPPDTPPAEDLTAREREVLALLAEGIANKTIAVRLGISEHTVKFHVNAILGKLGAQSRTEAVTRAARLGLLHL